jgi:arylmalonate decarboxylase
MRLSRRRLLRLASLGTACAALSPMAARTAEGTRLGLIFPPAGRGVPEEGIAMYGSRIEFLVENLGLETMTPAGYDAVIDRIGPSARRLAARGAEAIVLMGTSLSFYKGEELNQLLTRTMRDAAGLPSITMSTAVIEGLKAVGGHRVVAATAYNDEVNDRLRAFLTEHEFDVLAVQGLGIEAVGDIFSVTQPELIEFGAAVHGAAQNADSILVSCGGLRTLEILEPLEERTGVPAVSSTPHALFAGVKLLGADGRAPGYGRLLSS